MKAIATILAAAAAATLGASAAVNVTSPVNTACPTAFAIVTDSVTLDKTHDAISNYRSALEGDGLSTYIISDDWSSPDAVREAIKNLYAREPRLEGIVLVGDIPVAMVRNAQHMTTAFKMDEDNYPILDSSVPSDRFYDCLDLDFRYLKQDTAFSHLYYYELTEECPQRLNPTFYSARIRYPEGRGGDKYDEIAKFLNKAARAKTDMKADKVDRVVSFNGHGYNSDCLIAWMDDEKAYRENFPAAFTRGTDFKHWNFRQMQPMKYRLLEELERPGTDLFMFHEHGGPTTQYINGYGEAENAEQRLHFLKSGIYSRVKRAIKKGNPTDEVIEAFSKAYNLTPEFFAQLNDPEFNKTDSIGMMEKDIEAEELHNRITMPRMVMFNACYNGSFHESDYIAGNYIFNPGNTLVTQGNTRNVLQDRWTIEMIGLLSHGARAGQYNRLVATLEGHLIGDPTMHFAPLQENSLSADITLRKDDAAYWYELLDAPYADIRSLAVRMLQACVPEAELSPRLLSIYKSDPFNTTRMEALMMLARYDNADFTEALKLAVNDPYERIARMAADMAGDKGDPALLEPVVAAYIDGNERQRTNYIISNTLSLFPKEDVIAAINSYYDKNPRYNGNTERDEIIKEMSYAFVFAESHNAEMTDKKLSDRNRIFAIRFVRNNPHHASLDTYFSIIADDGNSDAVRTNMAEALGWFKYSYRKADILDFARKACADPSTPAPVAAELRQTVNRLK